ncbi:hypothetical protein GCM10009616_03670 [Microlunatus lacustris]
METDRVVRVPPERLRRWLDGFAERHGAVEATLSSDVVTLVADDGAAAVVTVPFLPWQPVGEPLDALLDHVGRTRAVGAVLVRKGGYAVGRFTGARLLESKVDSTYVQGRTKAGGWSQQRYARRRDNQSAKAYAETADVTARLLAPHAGSLDAVVGGGDPPAVAAVLADPRLAALRPLLQPRVLPVPDPRLRVLQAFPEQFLAVEIALNAQA